MLDLSTRKQKFFSLILSDGLRLDIPMPRAEIYDEMMEKLTNAQKAPKAKEIKKLVLDILNTNVQKVEIEPEEIDALSVSDLFAIVSGYANEIMNGLADPNFKSPLAGNQKTN